MSRLPRRLQIYVCIVILVGGFSPFGAWHAPWLSSSVPPGSHWVLMALIMSLAGLAYIVPVRLGPKRQVLTHAAVQTVAVLIFSPALAALLLALPTLLGNRLYLRREWFNSLFNVAQTTLTIVATGLLYRALAPVSLADPERSLRSVVALLPAAMVLYLVSALIVDGAAALQSRRSPMRGWWAMRAPTFVPHAFLVGVGGAVAPGAVDHPWLLVLAAVPVLIIRAMLRSALGFDTTVVAMAQSVANALGREGAEVAAAGTNGQSLTTLVEQVSRAWGMTEDDRSRMVLAAQLLPLVDVPLTGDEQHFTGYAATARFIERVLRQPVVAETIRCLDERFDGQGPQGLLGEAIPLDTRIVTVCRAWKELTSAQPYRPALSHHQALLTLHAGAGRQWDPAIVQLLDRTLSANVPTTTLQPVGAPQPVGGQLSAVA